MLKRILIVDDDDELLDVLKEALSYSDFEVKVLSSGRGLFELMDSFKPDLLLLDYMLPGDNGIDLCKKIRSTEKYAALPIVFISAYLSVLDGITCQGDILFKPFSLEILLGKIEEVLKSAPAL